MGELMAARGSDADYCLVWPDDGHSMEAHKPAHTTVSIRRCTFCGWVDGADLERQRSEAVADGRRQAAESIIAHRDKFWPRETRLDAGANSVRRHLNIAVQVANPPTEAEVREAIGDLLSGMAARNTEGTDHG